LDPVRVIGYYSLCMHRVRAVDLAEQIAKGGPDSVPAVLLARLARDSTMRGEGLGDLLMGDALKKVVAADGHVAARVLVVDAIDDAAATFYRRHGFTPSSSDPLTLAAKITDIEKTVAKMAELGT
jgi:predicted N-acetyltransferase YhbS